MVLLILVFSTVYHQMYLHHTKHFESSKHPSLTYAHFVWYALMINFTMPMGDIYPFTDTAKAVTAVQGMLFWYIIAAF